MSLNAFRMAFRGIGVYTPKGYLLAGTVPQKLPAFLHSAQPLKGRFRTYGHTPWYTTAWAKDQGVRVCLTHPENAENRCLYSDKELTTI